jgi:kynurenine formamidase
MKIIDLTQSVTDEMQVYPGDKSPKLIQTHFIEKNNYSNFELTTGMHVGTHIDGPFHMIDSISTINLTSLQKSIGKACIIDIQHTTEFSDIEIIKKIPKKCQILLFHTGRSKLFGTKEYFTNFPTISNKVAEHIASLGITMIGIDSSSPDNEPYEVHKILFKKGILIAENLTNLHLLLNKKTFEVFALPLKIEADSAPARVIAII